ncbi:MAG: Crp/Fnr family transcriptional regulator [Bacteroidia bacterium]
MFDSLIAYCNSIHALSKDAEQALCNISSTLQIEKNKDLQPIGHTCKTIYFIEKGALRIYYYKDGTDITESFEFENSIVARAESLFSGKPSKKAIQAIEDTTLIAIDANKLFILFDAFPEIERLFRKIIEQAYVKSINRLESIQFNTAEERYINLINEHKDVLKRVPLKYIASYLGITQVSLSRIRASM